MEFSYEKLVREESERQDRRSAYSALEGIGAISHNGRLIDLPVLVRARRMFDSAAVA